MVDYIIVGAGLAGIAFAETAMNNQKSIVVFDSAINSSSAVAAGLYNPVILKRFSGLQHAQEQLDALQSFYKQLELKLGKQFLFPMPIWRKFHSIEEQNDWFAASDKPALSPFLSSQLHFDALNSIDAPFGYGEVLQTGYVDTTSLLMGYRDYLLSIDSLTAEFFDYNQLQIDEDSVAYKGINAKHIVFAEGFGLSNNNYFKHEALNGTKGELLLIKTESLDLSVVVKAGLFVLPLGDDLYKVGATYEWDDKSYAPTQKGLKELKEKLSEIINCDYEIVEHLAGVRPTTRDRKALIGSHREHLKLHILNGLGTRGVMLAPYLAQMLFDHIEHGAAIPAALDVKRLR